MSASASLFGLGTSALSAYRSALTVTGNNISNVGVDGYTKQNADFVANTALKTNAGYVGTGVTTGDVYRSYDAFLTNQVSSATSSSSHFTRYHEYASIIDEVVADPDIGLTPSMMSFFNSVNDVSGAPASVPSRQVMHSEAESLVSRFNTMYTQMEDVREQTRKEYAEMVIEVNGIAESIAELNTRISQAYAKANGAAPNDLLDSRDDLARRLSENIGVTVVVQGDNMMNVFVGKGQPLVVADTVNSLSMGTSEYIGSNDISLVMDKAGTEVDITDSVTGGRAGGILEFTKEVLSPAQGALGRIAITLAATFNAQHRQGYGLDGENQRDFFQMGTTDDSLLDGTNAMVLSGAIESSSNSGSGDIGVTIPMVASADFDGDGDLDGEDHVQYVKSMVAKLTADDYQIDFDGTNYTVTNLSTNESTSYAQATFEATDGVEHDGLTLTVSGSVSSGDTFVIQSARGAARDIGMALDPSELSAIAASDTDGEHGNNANILELASLQTEKLMMAGASGSATAGLQEGYGQLVADIGVQTHYADINRTAQKSILDYAQNARDNASGVNLDEEAANLMKYQQMFQASTRIISVADELFKSVLNSVQ